MSVIKTETNEAYSADSISQAIKNPTSGISLNLQRGKLSESQNECVSEKMKQERQLVALKTYNMYKDEFSVPNACESKVWGKIAAIVREECPISDYYGAQQCWDEVRSIKNKYFKVGRGKLDVTSPDDAILFKEAKLAFDMIEPGSGSIKSKKLNRQKDDLTLLVAYNKYKDELSSCPESLKRAVWKKIAKQVRINRSVNGISGYNEKQCITQIMSLKRKYEKKKHRRSGVTNSSEVIFLHEAALAFEDPEFQGYDYRRDSYESGHGSNSQIEPSSALNDGIVEYGRVYTRDNYGNGYGNNSQCGLPNIWNEGNEYRSCYRGGSYGDGYGNNNRFGPPSALNDGNEYEMSYRRDTYGGVYRNNNQGRPPGAWNNGMGYR